MKQHLVRAAAAYQQHPPYHVSRQYFRQQQQPTRNNIASQHHQLATNKPFANKKQNFICIIHLCVLPDHFYHIPQLGKIQLKYVHSEQKEIKILQLDNFHGSLCRSPYT